MPAIMTLGGIALAVLGLLIAIAGMPDRAAGLGLGSDLIQAGASILAGGLIVAALGQVLRALRDVADRVEEAGFGLSQPRASLNDELAEEKPMPLPRANTRNAVPVQDEEFPEEPAPVPAARDSRPSRTPRELQQPVARSAREPQQPPRAPRGAEVTRQQPRQEPNFEAQQTDDDFADDMNTPRQEPRWMRAQAEANNRQQPAGVIPLQSNRQSRATPAAATPRREPASSAYDSNSRRRAPEPVEAEPAEATVVRSGIIGGMAYTLYSDGAIEAELPSGMVRFNSFAELQEHVKRAGADDQDGDYRGSNAAQH